VLQGVLRRRDITRKFRDDPCEGLHGPVQLKILYARLGRVLVLIPGEAVGRLWIARL
jgi:hypothetical protein